MFVSACSEKGPCLQEYSSLRRREGQTRRDRDSTNPVGGEFQTSPEFPPLRTDTIVHASSDYPHSSSDHNGFACRSPWRCAGGRRRIHSHQASIIDSQSFPSACPKSPHDGSAHRRILFTLDYAESGPSSSDRV